MWSLTEQEHINISTRTTLNLARGKCLVVVSGLAAVEHRAPSGRTLLALVGPGEIFTCPSRGIVVRRAHGLLNVTVGIRAAGKIPAEQRLNAADNHRRELAFRICILRIAPPDRIATGLAFLARMVGSKRTRTVFELQLIKHEYLGEFCSLTRCTVGEHLQALEDAGMVIRSKTGFLVQMESPRVWGPEATGSYFWRKRQ